MKVVILTRLAINPASDSDLRQLKPGEAPLFLDEHWLSARVDQMLNLSLRSLEIQSVPPDLHLIAVDERVVGRAKTLFGLNLPAFSEVLGLPSSQSFNELVRERLKSLAPDVVTVRLDSDDCLAAGFLERIRDRIDVGLAFNFPHGIQWDVSRGHVVHRAILSNPTVAYRSEDGSHVFDFGRHRLVQELVPTLNEWTISPMFLKVSHSHNHARFQSGGFPVLRPNTAVRKFGVPGEYLKPRVRFSPLPLIHLAVYVLIKRFPRVNSKIYRFINVSRNFVSLGGLRYFRSRTAERE
ncbi:putative rhamnosyl transferase [Pontimonas sp.]|nr:putative rhamnosyl transferase [Pontimonas sp.]